MAAPNNNKGCFARSAKGRAVLALGAPLLAWGYAVVALWTRGYSLLDYPFLIEMGHLTLFRQGVGWACTALWIARYWPSAIEDLRHTCLIWEEGEAIRFASGAAIPKDSIVSIRVGHGLAKKTVAISCRDGKTYEQSVMLTHEKAAEIVQELNSAIAPPNSRTRSDNSTPA